MNYSTAQSDRGVDDVDGVDGIDGVDGVDGVLMKEWGWGNGWGLGERAWAEVGL